MPPNVLHSFDIGRYVHGLINLARRPPHISDCALVASGLDDLLISLRLLGTRWLLVSTQSGLFKVLKGGDGRPSRSNVDFFAMGSFLRRVNLTQRRKVGVLAGVVSVWLQERPHNQHIFVIASVSGLRIVLRVIILRSET